MTITSQPQNTTVTVGSEATFNCSITGTRARPNWNISGEIYISSFLPKNHKYSNGRLTVSEVTMKNNGSTYKCFLVFRNGTILESTSAVMIVKKGNDEVEKDKDEVENSVNSGELFIPMQAMQGK